MKAVSYYGEVAAAEIFGGYVISKERISKYLKSIDVLPEDIIGFKDPSIDKSKLQSCFTDESDKQQIDTIENFVSCFEESKKEEKIGLALLISKIINSLS